MPHAQGSGGSLCSPLSLCFWTLGRGQTRGEGRSILRGESHVYLWIMPSREQVGSIPGDLGGDKWFPLGECITFGPCAVLWVGRPMVFISNFTSSSKIWNFLTEDSLPFPSPRNNKHRDCREGPLHVSVQPATQSHSPFLLHPHPNPPHLTLGSFCSAHHRNRAAAS